MSREAFRLELATREVTLRLGAAIGEGLAAGGIVALIGDLGAGKTTLTQGIARGAGWNGAVTSPTFALINVYDGPLPLVHIDPYRLVSPDEIMELGLADYLEQPCALVIEWANKIEALLPEDRLTIQLILASPADGESDAPREAVLWEGGPESARLLAAVIEALR